MGTMDIVEDRHGGHHRQHGRQTRQGHQDKEGEATTKGRQAEKSMHQQRNKDKAKEEEKATRKASGEGCNAEDHAVVLCQCCRFIYQCCLCHHRRRIAHSSLVLLLLPSLQLPATAATSAPARHEPPRPQCRCRRGQLKAAPQGRAAEPVALCP